MEEFHNMKMKWLTTVADRRWNPAACSYMLSCWVLYLGSWKLCICWMMELCCNVISWRGMKTYCLFLHSDKKNGCPDSVSTEYINSCKLMRDKTLNTFIFISGSPLTQPSCCRTFPFVHAWRNSHCWDGRSSHGPPGSHGFMAGYDKECHCSDSGSVAGRM